MPTTELLAPLGRVLFPLFVKVADDAEGLRAAFCKAIGIQTMFALPAGVGLALVAREAVPFLLGGAVVARHTAGTNLGVDQYFYCPEPCQWLCASCIGQGLFSGSSGLGTICHTCLSSLGSIPRCRRSGNRQYPACNDRLGFLPVHQPRCSLRQIDTFQRHICAYLAPCLRNRDHGIGNSLRSET